MAEKKRISYVQNCVANGADPSDARLSVPDELESGYPALCDYLSAVVFPDGSPREVSTLQFVVEDGVWKGCVNDRAQRRSLWRSGATLADVLESLEQALRDSRVVWRRWRAEPKEVRRKN